MNPRSTRRPRLPATLACAALIAVLPSLSGAAAADRAAGQPLVQASPTARASSPDSIEVRHGQFESGGKPVEDLYCVPIAAGPHPAVILLHGAVNRGYGNAGFAEQCRELAAAGYQAMFVEYYSQAGPARPGDPPVLGKDFAAWVNGNFPIWTREIASAIDLLGHDPTIERDRIALMGHSLGAFLALAVGASQGGRVAAIIEYYGALTNTPPSTVANMAPTLILHGSADRTVPVRYAYQLDALLTSYNRPHEMKIYPGAGHGLDSATRADAWQRSLDFLRRYLGK